jgi:acetyl esterase/lipase
MPPTRLTRGVRRVGLLCLLSLSIATAASAGDGRRLSTEEAYGPDPLQRMDIHRPAQVSGAPIIVMLHGGGWRHGDKANRAVVAHKAEHWLGHGVLFISVNTRLMPQADPLEQARDLAHAMARVQHAAIELGGDPARIVLMGHSAGAHLVSLLAASPRLQAEAGVRPWMATVSLDSAGYDIEAVMRRDHFRLYDQAFGTNVDLWRDASPAHQLRRPGPPQLAVCSSIRPDKPCRDAERYLAQARALGMIFELLPVALSHRAINNDLGEPGDYTARVDAFLRRIDPRWPVAP